MQIKKIGLITYHHPHLKSEQVLQRLLGLNREYEFRMFALPFMPRVPRKTLIQHRPDQSKAVHPQMMAEKHRISYAECSDDRDIDGSCDVYLVLGAGILSAECVEGKRIINAHPGLIPACRGLDSFKWAIYDAKPMGITLHYIDEQVDAGEIIATVPTYVYSTDSIITLSRRHYENEIDMMARFADFLDQPRNPYQDLEQGEAKRRMPREEEKEVTKRFHAYREQFGGREVE